MEVGIFQRLGLECTFPRLETGGPEAVAGVVRSEWEFAETGSAPYVQAARDGKDAMILLAAVGPRPTGLPILTTPKISEPAQLDVRGSPLAGGPGRPVVPRRARAGRAHRDPLRQCFRPYKYFVGQLIVRHMWADGESSKPRPSFGCLKLRPMTSVNSSSSTLSVGSNE